VTERRRRAVHVLAGLLAALFVLAATWTTYAWRLMREGAAVDDAAPSDAVVVLGCRVLPGGRPSPALRARTEHGVRVWRATGARFLVLTGGPVMDPVPEAVVMARIAAAADVPGSAVLLDPDARSTAGNAAGVARIARERGWRRVTLVSDPWHLPRARALFRRAGVPDVRQSPATASPNWTEPWARRRFMLRETAALLFVRP